MIVSDSEKFVFMHNPKVGGMTMRTALAAYDTRDNFFFEWRTVGDPPKRLDMAHITPFQFRRFFPEIFDGVVGYHKFGFVRNPYTRYLSALSQHLKLGTPYIRKAVMEDPGLFYSLANSFARNCLRKEPVERDFKLVHFRPQSHFLCLDRELWVDEVVRLEEPEADWSPQVAGWLGEGIGTIRNQTSEFGDGYDPTRLGPRCIQILNEFYQVDFKRFGYPMMKPKF